MNSVLNIGDVCPDFKLQATDNQIYSNYNFKDSKIIVVVFTCNHCPYAQAYEDRLINLQDTFKNSNVSFLAINANDDSSYPEDSFENMVKRAKEKNFNFPYLRDDSQITAKEFGASYTPEVFVFDDKRVLCYHGRIDDNWQEPTKVKKENLKESIDSLLSGKKIDSPITQAIGCTVKWSY